MKTNLQHSSITQTETAFTNLQVIIGVKVYLLKWNNERMNVQEKSEALSAWNCVVFWFLVVFFSVLPHLFLWWCSWI